MSAADMARAVGQNFAIGYNAVVEARDYIEKKKREKAAQEYLPGVFEEIEAEQARALTAHETYQGLLKDQSDGKWVDPVKLQSAYSSMVTQALTSHERMQMIVAKSIAGMAGNEFVEQALTPYATNLAQAGQQMQEAGIELARINASQVEQGREHDYRLDHLQREQAHQTSEREASQDWQSGESMLDRIFQGEQRAADRGVAMRGQDIDAYVATRGQDIGAETTRRGQDIGAATERRGQDFTKSLGEARIAMDHTIAKGSWANDRKLASMRGKVDLAKIAADREAHYLQRLTAHEANQIQKDWNEHMEDVNWEKLDLAERQLKFDEVLGRHQMTDADRRYLLEERVRVREQDLQEDFQNFQKDIGWAKLDQDSKAIAFEQWATRNGLALEEAKFFESTYVNRRNLGLDERRVGAMERGAEAEANQRNAEASRTRNLTQAENVEKWTELYQFVSAAKAAGLSDGQIMGMGVLPDSMRPEDITAHYQEYGEELAVQMQALEKDIQRAEEIGEDPSFFKEELDRLKREHYRIRRTQLESKRKYEDMGFAEEALRGLREIMKGGPSSPVRRLFDAIDRE